MSLILAVPSFSQNKVTHVVNKARLIDITYDNQENIYASDGSGNIYKYDKKWKIVNTYSPRSKTPFTSIDATSLKIYAFSASRQELVILNRFLSQPITYDLKQLDIAYATQVCRGPNNTIWLFDQSSLVVKNIDFASGEELVTINLQKHRPSKELEVVQLSFLKDQLLIHIKDFGILILDNLGNIKREIALSSSKVFGFNGNQIFYFYHKDLSSLYLNQELKQNFEMPAIALHGGIKLLRTMNKTLLLKADGIYDIETIYGH